MQSRSLKSHLIAVAFVSAGAISYGQSAPSENVPSQAVDTKPALSEAQLSSETPPRRMTDYRDVLHAMECSDFEVAAIQNGYATLANEWARNWAGVYTDSGVSTTERELYLLPETGVIFYSQGCFVVCYQVGQVSEVFPDGVRAKVNSELCSYLSSSESADWYFFDWNGHRCCLRLEEMISFVHAFSSMPANELEEMEQRITIRSRLRERGSDEFDDLENMPGTPNLSPVFSELLVREPLTVQVRSIDPGERVLQSRDWQENTLRYFTAHLNILEGSLRAGQRFTISSSHPQLPGIFTVESVSSDSNHVLGTLELVALASGVATPPVGSIHRYPGSPQN